MSSDVEAAVLALWEEAAESQLLVGQIEALDMCVLVRGPYV